MHCESIKQGVDCTLMTKKGCSFNGGKCHPVVESCEGCDRQLSLEAGAFCATFPEPAAKWRRGACNLATHVKNGKTETSRKVNPLKASKRSVAGR